MKLEQIFLLLAVAGGVIPYLPFMQFLMTHGMDVATFIEQLFASPVSTFFGLDVILSAVVLILFITVDGRRLAVPLKWLPVAATLTVGVSCGLPLYLALRERLLSAGAPVSEQP